MSPQEKLSRLGNLVANLAHQNGDHCENELEDEAHDLIRELCETWKDLYAEGVDAGRKLGVAHQRSVEAPLVEELELAAETFRDFSNVLRVIGKDTMSAAAGIAERHIREQLAALVDQTGEKSK